MTAKPTPDEIDAKLREYGYNPEEIANRGRGIGWMLGQLDDALTAISASESEVSALKAEIQNLKGKSSGKCAHEVETYSSRGCYNCVLIQAEKAEAELAMLRGSIASITSSKTAKLTPEAEAVIGLIDGLKAELAALKEGEHKNCVHRHQLDAVTKRAEMFEALSKTEQEDLATEMAAREKAEAELKTLKSLEAQAWNKAQFEADRAKKLEAELSDEEAAKYWWKKCGEIELSLKSCQEALAASEGRVKEQRERADRLQIEANKTFNLECQVKELEAKLAEEIADNVRLKQFISGKALSSSPDKEPNE